jgi:iron-sulfur cluster repair protein YtfE (RIC family)
MLNALRAFELDMHQHVHEENNVLFPRVRARIGASAERTER